MTSDKPRDQRAIEFVPAVERAASDLASLAASLLPAARSSGLPWLVASVLRGPAVVLGRVQRAGRVVDLARCDGEGVPVLRRATSGTAAWVGDEALYFALALPSPTALAPDATLPTLLNRYVRGFLKGFARAGAVAHYFGRESVAVAHRPAALLGLEVTHDGCVLIELIAGFDESIALPLRFCSADERARERYRGRAPVALRDPARPERTALAMADQIARGAAEFWNASPGTAALPPRTGTDSPLKVIDPLDPAPPDWVIGPTREVPIGCLESAVAPDGKTLWIGGDALAPTALLEHIARIAPVDLAGVARDAPLADALFGARLDDLVALAGDALAVARGGR